MISLRHQADRSARPACSSATRRTRSGTYSPSGTLAPQPSVRTAIHAFDGSRAPDRSLPEASCARSGRFQCAEVTSVHSVSTRDVSQPTRPASA